MKRLHLHVAVKNLEESIPFYTVLFGRSTDQNETGYAKWLLDDPRVSFAISPASSKGVDHPDIQVENDAELAELRHRLGQETWR